MSITELKKTADSLSPRERQWMRAYLFADERAGSAEWQKKIAAKRRKLKAGKGIQESNYKRRFNNALRKTI